jgi:prophage antirepressor-like protein
MLKQFKSKHYGKDIAVFYEKGHGPFWSAEEACKVLEIEDTDRAIAEIDSDGKFEAVVQEGIFKKLRRKIIALNWMGFSSLLFRSQAPIAKKFQRFVNNYIFFDMFLHATDYFEERWDWDENCMEEYGSILTDLDVNLGLPTD